MRNFNVKDIAVDLMVDCFWFTCMALLANDKPRFMLMARMIRIEIAMLGICAGYLLKAVLESLKLVLLWTTERHRAATIARIIHSHSPATRRAFLLFRS